MDILPIPARMVDRVWRYVRPALERAIYKSRSGEDIEAWRVGCERGRGHILIVLADGEESKGAIILQRDGDALLCVALAGDRGLIDEVPGLISAWRKIAVDNGYERITLKGRRGWERVLARHGFKDCGGGFLGASSHGI